MSDILSDGEIAVLNAARQILNAHREYKHDADYDEVRCATIAEVASEAIFDYLNNVHSHLNVEMTEEQLYGRKLTVTT